MKTSVDKALSSWLDNSAEKEVLEEEIPEELKKYIVYFEGKPHHSLNVELVKKQNLSDEKIERIKHLHVIRLDLHKKMALYEDSKVLQNMFQDITDLEYELQELWGFQPDITKQPWFKVPKCTCPKMDNEDDKPYLQHFVLTCPIHGSEGLVPYMSDKDVSKEKML